MNEYKLEIGCPVAQYLVGWGKERGASGTIRMFAAALIPTLEHGFSVRTTSNKEGYEQLRVNKETRSHEFDI